MKINNVSQASVPTEYRAPEATKKNLGKLDTSKTKATTTSQASNVSEEQLDDELMIKAVEQANKSLNHFDRIIERKEHEVTKTVMYTLKDTKTDEVIAEFPSKKVQDMVAKMWELAGLVFDEKV